MPLLNRLHSSSYFSTVRSAHGLADLLKRTRPHHCTKVEQLKGIVTCAHNTLHEWNQISKHGAELDGQEARIYLTNLAHVSPVTVALGELDAAYQALRDLKHAGTAKE